MTAVDVDEAIARLARGQHGAFSRQQAFGLGATKSFVERRTAAKRWIVMTPGVYVLSGTPSTWEQRQMVACLAAGPDAVLSHRAAAALHGFPGFRRGPSEITVPWTVATRRAGRVHRATDISTAHTTNVCGIPVTKKLRTLLDLSAVIPETAFADALDELVTTGVLDFEKILTAAARYAHRGKKGSRAMRKVLEQRGPGYIPPESKLERKLLTVLRQGGLPQPVAQHPLPAITISGRVDFAYPEARLLVEADSRRWHTGRTSMWLDRQRDNEAAARGWRTLRFGWDDLVTRPEWVRQVVRSCLLGASAPLYEDQLHRER